jgi:SAM-dependent methyltransferase
MDPYWYRTFFDGVTVDWWRSAATPEWTKADVDLAWKELHLDAGRRVLDCPCGTGRHAIELARRGCQVTGIDISAYSLDLARRDAAEAGAIVDFREGDMLDLGYLPEVDAALTLGNSLGYLDHAGTCRFVQTVAAALRQGGRWLIDTGAVAESILPTLKPALDFESGGIQVHIANNYLAAESCLETTFEFRHDGQTETRRTWQFVFTVAEIRRMLAAAGLNTVALYGWGSGEPYSLGSQGLCLVAEKQREAS